MSVVMITRKIEFDAGHRIPDHASKCRNAHGHRYVLEATVGGEVNDAPGSSDNGMVGDFGDLKAIMMEAVGEPWDHAFLVHHDDVLMCHALELLGKSHKTVMLPCVPTVENLVKLAAEAIAGRLKFGYLDAVRLYETPNCWADWHRANPT